MRYVIAYDISDDGRRDRVATALESRGRRVQYSVFECELDGQELATALDALDASIMPAADRVRIYRLCGACVRETHSLGTHVRAAEPDVWIV